MRSEVETRSLQPSSPIPSPPWLRMSASRKLSTHSRTCSPLIPTRSEVKPKEPEDIKRHGSQSSMSFCLWLKGTTRRVEYRYQGAACSAPVLHISLPAYYLLNYNPAFSTCAAFISWFLYAVTSVCILSLGFSRSLIDASWFKVSIRYAIYLLISQLI